MVFQVEFSLDPKNKGFHLITSEITRNVPKMPSTGILHLFIKHTSAALAINENTDPDVRIDLNNIFDKLVKENENYYLHTLEGEDDMPAHAKSIIVGPSLTIPIRHSRLNIGTWQSIYLCEFRNNGGRRRIVATVIGE